MPHRGVIKPSHKFRKSYKPSTDYLSSTYDKPYLLQLLDSLEHKNRV